MCTVALLADHGGHASLESATVCSCRQLSRCTAKTGAVLLTAVKRNVFSRPVASPKKNGGARKKKSSTRIFSRRPVHNTHDSARRVTPHVSPPTPRAQILKATATTTTTNRALAPVSINLTHRPPNFLFLNAPKPQLIVAKPLWLSKCTHSRFEQPPTSSPSPPS